MPAILGSARLANFRLGYETAALAAIRETRVTILLAGVFASGATSNPRVRIAGLTIHDALNEAPNTCSLTVQDTAPLVGQDLRITINSDAPRLLFNGTLQTVDLSYEGLPDQLAWACTAVDDTSRANRKRPFGTWTQISATTIAQSLVATFAPGFTSTHVEAALPLVTITFDGSTTLSGALAQLTQLIGGYHYWEDGDLHLFLTEATDVPATIDGSPGNFLNSPPINASSDDAQVRTRVYGKGHGENLLTDVDAGETILPLVDVVMNNPSGGQVIAGTTPDGAQSQILTYTGVILGGVGSLVGPAASPSVAPTMTAASGAGVESGVHGGAYTFVTASGESIPSPLGTVTTGAMDPPPIPTPDSFSSFGSLGTGAYSWAWTFTNASGETTAGPLYTFTTGVSHSVILNLPIGPAGTTSRKLYRTVVGGAQLKLDLTNAGNGAGTVLSTQADGSLGANVPVTNTATANQIDWSGIAIGPTGTTQRKVYRTAAGLSQLKLQQTIANNTATVGVIDSTPDASLGANAPTSDTSGLTTVDGQVNAGSTSLLTSGWPFATAGWVLIGQQVVRYTGVTGNTLTGIPATGNGALVSTVKYGEHVDVAPSLTGVTGLTLAMLKGTPVHIWITRNDLAAQAALVALDLAQGRVTDGVVEHLITDMRRGEASLIALCDADLLQFSRPLVTVTVDSRDVRMKSGKPLTFNLTSPPISETLTIQAVDITELDLSPGTPPRFHVTASSVRFSLEDILRRLIVEQAA